MKNEKGSALVLTLWVIIIVILLMTGLSLAINNRINFVGNYEDRLKASYNAEAGIEESLAEIKNNISISEEELKQISGFSGKYNIINAEKFPDYYKIKSKGDSNGLSRYIIAHITTGENGETVKAGGEIDKEYSAGKGNGNVWDTYIENNSYISNASIVELTQEDLEGYSDDALKVYNSKQTVDSGQFVNWVNQYDAIYINGDLDIEEKGKNNSMNGGQPPLLLMVTGDIYIEGFRNLDNIIFICLGDFDYNQPNAHVDFNNVFVYSGNNINFSKNKGKGNPTLSPHFEYSGRIIASNNVTLYTKDGEVNKDGYNINLPEIFSEISGNKSPEVIYWQES